MAMNRADYHPDWPSISRQIRAQAGDRCEFCGVKNGATGARDRWGDWHHEEDIDDVDSATGYDLFGGDGWPKIIRIVLTVAHLDHDKTNNDPCNLRALCQRCHLNWDRARHIANRRRNAIRKSGQRLFEGFEA
jgi:hypothetical protein